MTRCSDDRSGLGPPGHYRHHRCCPGQARRQPLRRCRCRTRRCAPPGTFTLVADARVSPRFVVVPVDCRTAARPRRILRKTPWATQEQWLRGAAGRSIPDLATPVRIRLALSELGTPFIKFGQMLSTRPDLVGQDVARELTHLQSHTPPDPPGVAEATIEKELGSDRVKLFAWFNPTPLPQRRSRRCSTRACTAARTSWSRFKRMVSRAGWKPTSVCLRTSPP